VTLSAGTKLGPYEIEEPIGAGGMGEVYKAKDTRLERTVAVKVLPPHLSSSEEMRQRFEREAKTISQLSHSHICALYDVGREGDTEFLVMEYLEGQTLAEKLATGPLSVEPTLRYGIEIADALDKAHRQGIVHRDLKPGNVMITKSGVKLLDFGLAKYQVAAQPVSGVSRLATEAQASPPLTERGTVLGTFQYMAPEQLEGKEADARTDIFAFGCVLYEMATGHKAFTGKSQASLIGSIMNKEPAPISQVAPMMPPALNRVVKTCLAKDPDDRFQTAHDVRLQLQWVAEGGSEAGLPAPVVARRKNRERLAWGLFAVSFVGAVALGIVVWGYARQKPAPAIVTRFDVAPPEGLIALDMPQVSPDGRVIAFNGTDSSGKSRIWLRTMNDLTVRPLEGTEGASRPFWSPDGRFLAFMVDGKLVKIDVSGGPPQKICDAQDGDGTWNSEGVILYDGPLGVPIQRVSASGGTPVPEVEPDPARKETRVGWPSFLPDGRHYLYVALSEKPEDSMYRIGSLGSKESKPVASAQTLITYTPPGYLLFVRDKTLVAQRFDLEALKTIGDPVPVAEKLGTDAVGLARFSVSRNGTLAYRTADRGNRLLWLDASGKEIETVAASGQYGNPALSPKGDRLAFDLAAAGNGGVDIWVRDLSRGVNSRFTFSKSNDICPLWSPDGSRIVFTSRRDGSPALVEKPASGQGEEKLLLKSDSGLIVASDWSRDGRYIAYERRGKESWDLFALPTSGDRKPLTVAAKPFNEFGPLFSPDGRFVAYESNESGRPEIYVQTFPEPTGRWQISTAGGQDPSWSRDGKQIFYRSEDQKLMAVDVRAGEDFQAGIPRALFATRVPSGANRNRYVASADGKRFLFVAAPGREAISPTTVVLNWPAALGK
jgi:Tol biopolymer transport system component/predicted Ser/Thr protein kinase